jgi:uncharacterized protein (TIGR04222 family)
VRLTSQQADLYSRICTFQIDGGSSLHTFEDQLAAENGWSGAFTRRAIEEYRKFLLLAATVGHAVSPSDVVDQVWHLHLLRTRSYWDELCAKVLPQPLHHEPSRGGSEERAKFEAWYANTLESYRRTFACDPPAGIWPVPGNGQTRAERHRRVDVSRNWVLPRRSVAHATLVVVLVVALLALASGCGPVMTRDGATATLAVVNPLDLRGPKFLGLYVVAFAIAMILAATLRAAARGGATLAGDREDLDAYEIAYLRGGARQVVNAAVTRLVARDLLTVSRDDGTLRANTPVPGDLYPVEAAALRAVSATLGTPMPRVYSAVSHDAERVARRLRDRELIVEESRARAVAAVGTLITLTVPAVGLIKIFVGLSRGRPVGFLVAACIISTMLALAIFARRPHRTRRGEAVLRRLAREHAALRRPRLHMTEPASDLPLAVALFGMSTLAGTDYAALRRTARDDTSSCTSSSCGGWGCGGSSCGGGGCGGGGCGGGGCGGCGGS